MLHYPQLPQCKPKGCAEIKKMYWGTETLPYVGS